MSDSEFHSWKSQLGENERNTYSNLFKRVDADEKGIVLHDEAIPFLKKSNLPDNILTQFWNACDTENKGFLTEQEFYTILKLIACAQHGVVTGDPILRTQVGLPEFNGAGNTTSQNINRTPVPIPSQVTGNSDTIYPEDRQKYIGLFNSFGPENNILSGDRARAAFVRSNLPSNILQTIWNLADTRRTGSLNQTEFIIAMFYMERAMRGQTQFPPTLPASVYASATGRPAASPLIRNNTLHINSPPPIPRRSPVFKNPTLGTPVQISQEEYNKYATFFNQLDTDDSGFVSGSDAVVFFKHSKLPDSDLARIWDLADTNSSGQLNEHEFVMAMYMINQRVGGANIPSSAPLLNTNLSHAQQYQPFQQQQQQQQPQQQQNIDLLGLDSDFADSFTPAPPAAPTHQHNVDATRAESAQLQSSIANETNKTQQAQQQFNIETQNVNELMKQIQVQKEALTKAKREAEEAESRLEQEKKRKEALTQELQMYRQETKHFTTRTENAQQETEKIKNDIKKMEKSKESSPTQALSPPNQHDVFSFASATSPVGLFAKVNEPMPTASNSNSPLFATVKKTDNDISRSHTTSPKAKTFDPFAGFKVSNSAAPSPTVSMNKLKEIRSSTPNSNIDIGEIESKFPDLNTMEQSFAPPKANTMTSPTISVASAPASATSPPMAFRNNTKTVAPEPKKNASVSKYGFDLSAFETSSTGPNTNSSPFGDYQTTSVKDELSSLFSSPTTSTAPLPQQQKSGFDDIFGASHDNNTTSTAKRDDTFESIFFQK